MFIFCFFFEKKISWLRIDKIFLLPDYSTKKSVDAMDTKKSKNPTIYEFNKNKI
jgi:hypothetical protein